MFKKGRYSGLIRPISYGIDLFIIHFFGYEFFHPGIPFFNFFIFISIGWVFLSLRSRYYEIYRFTHLTKIMSLVGKQAVVFLLIVYSFFGFYNDFNVDPSLIFNYFITVVILTTVFKLAVFFLLKKFRSFLKGNVRRVVIIGHNQKTEQLRKFFIQRPEFGYSLVKIFDIKGDNKQTMEDCFDYISHNNIDEIYSSVSEITNQNIVKLIDYADNNLKILKFLPDNKEIYTKQLDFTYYGVLPILALRKIPMDEPFNKFVKRGFDILLSLSVIIGILSWLTPLLGLLIKLESKGPIFFKQKRNGLDYKEFYCYKFRSMKPNPMADLHQIKKGDIRVTKVGKLIRKTSIDELPQFINVLKGEMSVVGPRPHMVSHTHMYAERIDKFMVRHFIKPGITGLAQVSGFRGEVDSDNHIISRVKYDIFYLENWSLFLDLKIVFQTVYNAVRGEDKAY